MTLHQQITRGVIPARLTVADVLRLQDEGVIGEDENFELIAGEIVPMAAMKSGAHERIKNRLVRLLNRALPDALGVFVESSIPFAEDTYLEPDIAVFDAALDTHRATGADMLLVIEVASSSIGFDLRVKSGLYAAFGVRDYWVIDAVRETVRVHREPGDSGYRAVVEWTASQIVTPLLLPDLAIRLDRLT
ncbi:MAG: Uma2 family endonuclease [Sphingomonadaceae bacterium]